MKIEHLPDDYRGMIIDGRSQFWSFGQGYYRKHNGTVVYRHGKRILDLQHGTAPLKKLIKEASAELTLFGV